MKKTAQTEKVMKVPEIKILDLLEFFYEGEYVLIISICPWYLLAAGFRSECDTLVQKTTQYDSAPDTCPANSYSCVNKADALVEKNEAQTACNTQKQECT